MLTCIPIYYEFSRAFIVLQPVWEPTRINGARGNRHGRSRADVGARPQRGGALQSRGHEVVAMIVQSSVCSDR